MKKLILVALVAGTLAGLFIAFHWLRGETAYEEAVRELEAEAVVGEAAPPV